MNMARHVENEKHDENENEYVKTSKTNDKTYCKNLVKINLISFIIFQENKQYTYICLCIYIHKNTGGEKFFIYSSS